MYSATSFSTVMTTLPGNNELITQVNKAPPSYSEVMAHRNQIPPSYESVVQAQPSCSNRPDTSSGVVTSQPGSRNSSFRSLSTQPVVHRTCSKHSLRALKVITATACAAGGSATVGYILCRQCAVAATSGTVSGLFGCTLSCLCVKN